MRKLRAMALLVLELGVACATARAQAPAAKPPALPPINPGAAHLGQTLGGLPGPGMALAANEALGILAAGTETGHLLYWTRGVVLGIRVGDQTPNQLLAHQGSLTALAWGRGGVLASAGADHQVALWDLPEGKRLQTLPATGSIRTLAMNAEGTLLAGAGDEGTIQLWEIPSGKPIARWPAHADWILALAFAPDGKSLASAGQEPVIRIWEVPSGKKRLDVASRPPMPANAPPPGPNPLTALSFSPDGKLLAIGGADGLVHLAGTSDGKIVRTLTGHESSVTALAFHPAGTVLVSASRDRTLRLWDVASGQPQKVLEGHTSWVQGAAFLIEGTRLASVGADATVRLWDLR